jgi:hypothetical protein
VEAALELNKGKSARLRIAATDSLDFIRFVIRLGNHGNLSRSERPWESTVPDLSGDRFNF